VLRKIFGFKNDELSEQFKVLYDKNFVGYRCLLVSLGQ